MKTILRIFPVTMLSNAIGAAVVFFYFAYIDIATFLSNKAFWRGNEADWGTFFVSTLVTLLVGAGLVMRYMEPLFPWQKQLEAGQPPAEIPLIIRRRAANVPLANAALSWSMWLLVAFFFGMGARSFGSTDAQIFWRTFTGIGLVGGLTICTLVYLLTERAWQPSLAQFFPEGKIAAVGARRVSVGLRLLATFLLTGLVPLISLGMAAQNSAINIMDSQLDPYEILNQLRLTVFFLAGVSLVSNILLTLLTTRSLLGPLHSLTAAMSRVASQGDLATRVPVKSNDEIGDLTDSFNTMLDELQQGQRMRDLFGRYVSKEVATQVLQEGGAHLGGVNSQATALFADIRDFTSLAERLPPEQVVEILNRYYTHMVDVIVAEGGIVNKFGGDSLLAIFGVPIRQSDHALRAVRAAWQMNRALAAFNAEQVALGMPPLSIGIGISSGEVLAGNVGGEARLEYTIIGDPVNLAARLQSLTKEYGTQVLLSEFTASGLGTAASLRSLGLVQVRGKGDSVQVYQLEGISG